MSEESQHPLETQQGARSRVAQAQALRDQACTGGMRFEAYLPPDLALWVLEMVEQGVFVDPSEAVFVFMQQARELDPHDDLKSELLSRRLQAGMDGPTLSAEELHRNLEDAARRRTAPALWVKIDKHQPE